MSGTHRFWSIYDYKSCGGAPTGVFMQRLNDCASHVANGSNCTAKYSNETLVGYVNESCHDGRVAGLDELFDGKSYMAYDYYYNNNDCTDYENSAAYLASGYCETLYDNYSRSRSATISVSNGTLVWKRNMGNTTTAVESSALNCLGSAGLGYYEFDVPIEDISDATCQNFDNIGGGFTTVYCENVTLKKLHFLHCIRW